MRSVCVPYHGFMSESGPMLDRRALLVQAELAGARLEAGPLSDLRWAVPGGVELRHEPTTELRKVSGRIPNVPSDDPGSWSLRWRWSGVLTEDEMVAPHGRLLLRFASLADSPPEAYLEFAQRWGPLRLCGHGLPGTHVPSRWVDVVPGLPGCGALDLLAPVESVEVWRSYAIQAASIIMITAQLRTSVPTEKPLWTPMRRLEHDEPLEAAIYWEEDYSDLDRTDRPTRQEVVVSQREGLAHWINWWLALSGAAPRFDPERGLVTLATGGLFAALAYKLATLFNADNYIICCAVCGEFDDRDRKPQAGRRTYCSDPDCSERGRRRMSYAKP